MIRAAGEHAEVSGAMNLGTASELLAAGRAALVLPHTTFDLDAVTEADSSALAVIFGWLREAERQGKRLTVANAPQGLLSLAELYGVTDLLPLSRTQPSQS